MKINKTQEDGKITLALDGRLDTATAPNLQEVLIPAIGDVSEVILDFTDLAYISSAGLRVLLMGEKATKSGDSKMTLINVSEEIMEIFDMTGFADMLNIT